MVSRTIYPGDVEWFPSEMSSGWEFRFRQTRTHSTCMNVWLLSRFPNPPSGMLPAHNWSSPSQVSLRYSGMRDTASDVVHFGVPSKVDVSTAFSNWMFWIGYSSIRSEYLSTVGWRQYS